MLSLKLVLDTLRNNFSDNRIIPFQCYSDAVITDGKITASNINEVFPVNCYVKIEGSVFNNNYFKITANGTDYIEAAELVADPINKITVKACFIPDDVINFALNTNLEDIPTKKSEKIGSYSYTNDSTGVQSFIRDSLNPYYQGVLI